MMAATGRGVGKGGRDTPLGRIVGRCRLLPVAGVIAVGITAAACGSSAQPTTTTTAASTGGGSSIVKLSHTSLGTILTTSSAMTLYYDTTDTPTKISCTGSCAQAWPPLLFTGTGTPSAPGVTGLGTIKRPGGGTQVTWDKKPLYTFASDTPGKTTGQGVAGFQVAVVSSSGGGGSSTTTATTSGGY
jgi:predicted lipoprotein with Yx(FWY)xxD motif